MTPTSLAEEETANINTADGQLKRCNKCGRMLPLSAFHKCQRNADGLQYACKACPKEQMHKWYTARTSTPKGSNPDLAAFTPRELIAELRSRGYTGTLEYVQKIML